MEKVENGGPSIPQPKLPPQAGLLDPPFDTGRYEVGGATSSVSTNQTAATLVHLSPRPPQPHVPFRHGCWSFLYVQLVWRVTNQLSVFVPPILCSVTPAFNRIHSFLFSKGSVPPLPPK